ncbi:MAG: fumarate hydratase [Candidatus Omnitrophica bacterium]|nr:fumarate hydratase [Candidatus Omnitrophota bacterium]
MKTVSVRSIKDLVARLCVEANIILRPDIEAALRTGYRQEANKRSREILGMLLENSRLARTRKLALCQDTGMAVVYVDVGQGVRLTGGSLEHAVHQGVREGYRKGYFRESVVRDPLSRKGKLSGAPAVVHTSLVPGDKVTVTVSPKGFGSENKSRVKMFLPTDTTDTIKKFIVKTVEEAGPSACPPFVIGVGIGGTFEMACYLAKKSLLRPVTKRNRKPGLKKLEQALMRDINNLHIGPMGLGGKTTCLGVNILDYPTHIAGLPVAVNIGCHATRSATGNL